MHGGASTDDRGTAQQPVGGEGGLAPLCRFGRYEVLGRLAVGGMAELYLAHESIAGEPLRRVVIKLLSRHEHAPVDPSWEAMLEREGRTAARLDHPNICHVYECGRVGSQFFIAMEWVDGVSLRELVMRLRDTGGTLPVWLSANIAAQVAAALEHAHTALDAHDARIGVVHRDVNPTNIMIRYDGVVKLVDFGVAQVDQHRHDPSSQRIQGKLAYMAPEQVRGEPLDHRVDVFALGVCLYELFTGVRLYRRPTAHAVRDALLDGDVPSPRALNAGLPAALDAIVQRALQKDPAQRFPSAGELQAALEDVLAREGQVVGARPLAALMREAMGERGSIPPLLRDAEVAQKWARLLGEERPSAPPAPAPSRLPADNSERLHVPARAPALRRAWPLALAAAALWLALRITADGAPVRRSGRQPPASAPASAVASSVNASAPHRPAAAPSAVVAPTALAEPGPTAADEQPTKRTRARRTRPMATFLHDPGF